MKLCLTTLGCPGWDLDTICKRGPEYGYEGVDFRGLQDALDVTVIPEFTSDLATTKRKLADAGLTVTCISSSLRVCDETKMEANLEEARRTIPIAAELGVPHIRVFGGGNSKAHTKVEMADIGQEMMEAVLALDGARQFKWVFETHDEWISSAECKLLLDRIPDRAFGALWDMGHTSRVGGEAPAETLKALGDRVYYLHVKDAVYDTSHPQAMKDGWRYVAPGAGQLPLAEAIGLLRQEGYDGWVMFEHEKRWHAELPEPEEIFPVFVAWFRAV